MAKYFQRLGTSKYNFLVQIKLVSFQADVKEPMSLSILWVRGPSKEESKQFTAMPGEGELQLNQKFQRISQMYKDEKKKVFLKKLVINFFLN